MPNINLIATRRAEKKRLERTTRNLFFGITVEVAALLLLGSYIGAQRMALNGALSDADSKIVKLQPTINRIAQMDKDLNVLRPKLDTLETAREETQRWRAMLQIVSQSIPASAWLSGLSSTTGEGDATITLTGAAASQTIVGDTMTRLGSFPIFDNVELRFTQLASGQDAALRFNFEIGAHLKPTHPPDPPKPADEPEKKAENGGGSNG